MKRILFLAVVLCYTMLCVEAKAGDEVVKKKVCVMERDALTYEWSPAVGYEIESASSAVTDENGVAVLDISIDEDGSSKFYTWQYSPYSSIKSMQVYNPIPDTIYIESGGIRTLIDAYANLYVTRNILKIKEDIKKRMYRMNLAGYAGFRVYLSLVSNEDLYNRFINGDLDYEGFAENSDFLLLNPTDENLTKWIQHKYTSCVPVEDLSFCNIVYKLLGRTEELYESYKQVAESDHFLGNVSEDIIDIAVEKHDTTYLRKFISSSFFGIGRLGDEYNAKGNQCCRKGDFDNAMKYYDAAYVAYDCLKNPTERKSNLLYPMANYALVAQSRHEPDAEEKWMKTLDLVTELEGSVNSGTARRAWTERALADYYGGVGQTADALKYYDLAIKNYTIASKQNAGELRELENTLWRKATFCQKVGDVKKAEKTFKQEIVVLDQLIATEGSMWGKNKTDIEFAIKQLKSK